MKLLSFFDYIPKHYADPSLSTLTNFHQGFMIVFTIILSALVIIFRHKLKDWKYDKLFRRVVGYILIVNVFGYYIWVAAYGHFEWTVTIPITFCPVSGLVTGYILVSDNYKLYPYAFFTGIFGGLMSLIFPDDLQAGPQYYRFYNFYIQHSGIIVLPIYLAAVHDQTPKFKGLRDGILMTLCVALFGLFMNWVNDWETKFAEANPFKPVSGTPLEMIAEITNQSVFWYFLSSAIILSIIYLVMMLLANSKYYYSKLRQKKDL